MKKEVSDLHGLCWVFMAGLARIHEALFCSLCIEHLPVIACWCYALGMMKQPCVLMESWSLHWFVSLSKHYCHSTCACHYLIEG